MILRTHQRIALIVLVGLGCSTESYSDPKTSSPAQVNEQVTNLFGGSESIDAIRNANKLEAFRLQDESWHQKDLENYTKTSGPVTVSDARTETLKRLLLDSASYEWEIAKGCEPNYGIQLKFSREKKRVDILLCLDCDILAIYEDGKHVGSEDFDKIRPSLVRELKAIFPDDSIVQSLKERR